MDSTDSHDGDEAAAKEMLAMQGHKGSREGDGLSLSLGLMDPSAYIDMWEP
jgi:hypothetical protein